MKAPGFLNKLEISRNGKVEETIPYTTGGAIIYEFDKTVDPTWVGSSQKFDFVLYDNQNQKSDAYTFTAQISNIAPTYKIEDITRGGKAYKKITGNINIDETLASNVNWLLSGVINIEDLTTVTVEPGTTLYAETAATFVNVQPGGKMIANGTAARPIVMTTINRAEGETTAPAPGNWVGLTVNGSATVQNSGSYKYIRVEYGGNGNDAFKFVNVGSQTVVDYVQAYRSADNGFRINGGNVNIKHAVGTSNVAVNMRYGAAWKGTGQFWLSVSTAPATVGIQGRDADSNPILSNVTIVGPLLLPTPAATGGEGIRVRNNAKISMYNAIVSGVETSIRFSDGSENFVPTGKVIFRNSISSGNTANTGTGFHSSSSVFNPTSSSYVAANRNSVDRFTFTSSYIGTSTAVSVNPNTINPALEAANYSGAVQRGSDWTVGWVRISDSAIRQ
ncbi:MAG: hypothetical protein ACRCVT_14030, partial [Leadbetterella sp.]